MSTAVTADEERVASPPSAVVRTQDDYDRITGTGASAPASARCPSCRMPFAPTEIRNDHGIPYALSPCCRKTVWLDNVARPALDAHQPLRASDIAQEAARLVSTDREAMHGDKLANMTCIAFLWNGYLDALTHSRSVANPSLTPTDVASLCELLKVARRLTGAHNLDDYIDGAGYAAVAGEIAERCHANTVSPVTTTDGSRGRST